MTEFFGNGQKRESGTVQFRSPGGKCGLYQGLLVLLVSARLLRLHLCAGRLALTLDTDGVEADQLLGLLLHAVDAGLDLLTLRFSMRSLRMPRFLFSGSVIKRFISSSKASAFATKVRCALWATCARLFCSSTIGICSSPEEFFPLV